VRRDGQIITNAPADAPEITSANPAIFPPCKSTAIESICQRALVSGCYGLREPHPKPLSTSGSRTSDNPAVLPKRGRPL